MFAKLQATNFHKNFPSFAHAAKRVTLLFTGIVALFFVQGSGAESLDLRWDPAQGDPRVTGYEVHYGLASGQYAWNVDANANGASTSTHTVSNLEQGRTYYFAVRARNHDETIVSTFSNEITSTIPQAGTPTVTFTSQTTSGEAPLSVTFSDQSTGNVDSWWWDFGDGTNGSQQHPTHTYDSPGTFSVALTVTGPGGSATETKTGYINVGTTTPPTPVAEFAANHTSGTAPLSVVFADASTGDIAGWSWDFGDGGTGTGQTAAYEYKEPGTYDVSLTVTSAGGASDTKRKANYVTASPVGNDGGNGTVAGLVAAYGFEDPDEFQILDISGNSNNGTLSGATRTTAGWFGNAISFDGVDNWITIEDADSLDLSGGMTLEAWVYPTETMNGWHTVLLKEQTGGLIYGLYANSNSNQPVASVQINGDRNLHGGARLPSNQWTHLAATYDGTTERLYVDGTEVASRLLSGNISLSGGALRIGGNNSWHDEFFKGYIDEVRVYNRALTANEIHADMTTPVEDSETTEPSLMETGELDIDDRWQHVQFARSFVDPVVVAKPSSANDDEPALVRIRDVDATGFDIRLQEWDYQDGTHGSETVAYLVMEYGSHVLSDGISVEAGRMDTAKTKAFDTVSFNTEFPVNPVVLAGVTTSDDDDAVAARIRRITTTGFEVGMVEQEANVQTHTIETISYIAWEPSAGTIDGISFEVGRTADVVKHKAYTISYPSTFELRPLFLADMQTTDGGDTANLRWQNKTTTSVDVWVDEEQSKNRETKHTTEVVGFMIFGR